GTAAASGTPAYSGAPTYSTPSSPYANAGMPPEPEYDDDGNIVSFADPMSAATGGAAGFPPGNAPASTTDTTVPGDSYTSFIPQEGKEGQEFYKFERLILQA
ncbi:DNA primase, partial [Klebsiella oxytoca]